MSVKQSLREASLHSLSLVFGALGGLLGLLVMAIMEGWLPLPIGVVVGLYVALLLAYHNVRSDKDSLGALLAATKTKVLDNSPKLVGFVDVVSINEVSDDECRMLVCLNVTNAGTASIAQHYQIILTVDDKQVPVRKLRPQPSEIIEVVDEDKTLKIGGEQLISFKTYPNPIPQGGGERGLLVCHIPKNPSEHWSFVVEFNDVTGKTVSTPVFQPSIRTKSSDVKELLGWSGLKVELNAESAVPPSKDLRR